MTGKLGAAVLIAGISLPSYSQQYRRYRSHTLVSSYVSMSSNTMIVGTVRKQRGLYQGMTNM
jgi:hypothetical protein